MFGSSECSVEVGFHLLHCVVILGSVINKPQMLGEVKFTSHPWNSSTQVSLVSRRPPCADSEVQAFPLCGSALP